jgi:hypothetical protein
MIVCYTQNLDFSEKIYLLVKPDYSVIENDYHGVIVTCLKAHFLANSKH